jgi:hypothetical protein
MFSRCPRCDKGQLNSSGTCIECGYTLRISCSKCGCKNIPLAKFCGNCGIGLTFQTRLNCAINKSFSIFFRQKIRKLCAGAAFGTLLGLFAFGSMGMNNVQNSEPVSQNLEISYEASNKFIGKHFYETITALENFKNSRCSEKAVAFEDLISFTELMVRHLKVMKKAQGFHTDTKAIDYLGNVLSNARKDKVTRSTAGMLFFNIATDLLDVSWKDFSDEPEYSDIPRFHFMIVPANGLRELGINLTRDSETFGLHDEISVDQLYFAGIALVQASDIRLKQILFSALEPR